MRPIYIFGLMSSIPYLSSKLVYKLNNIKNLGLSQYSEHPSQSFLRRLSRDKKWRLPHRYLLHFRASKTLRFTDTRRLRELLNILCIMYSYFIYDQPNSITLNS